MCLWSEALDVQTVISLLLFQGIPSLTSTATLTIEILDENDNPPEFVLSQYAAAVPENATVGTEVVKVLATSRDIGLNAKMAYSITAGNKNMKFVIDESEGKWQNFRQKKFRIDKKGFLKKLSLSIGYKCFHFLVGVIRVANDLDREVTSVYFLTVMATDLSDSPLSSSTYVRINITDVNDNKPFFSQASYRTSLLEDTAVGQLVYQVLNWFCSLSTIIYRLLWLLWISWHVSLLF